LPREIPSILQFEMDQTRLGLRRPEQVPQSVVVSFGEESVAACVSSRRRLAQQADDLSTRIIQ